MCLNAGGQRRLDAESETLIPTIGGVFSAQAFDWQSGGAGHPHRQHGNETAIIGMQPVAFTQNSRSEVRQIGGDGQVVGALAADAGSQQQNYIAFHPTQDPISSSDGSTHAMGCGSKGGAATVALQDVRAMSKAQNGRGWNADGTAYTVDTHATQGVATAMQVRRLTPTECERLQGFPDGYTAIPWRGKTASECPDGPRYKALGNSWAVPVVRWIGRRIAAATSSHPSPFQTS
jgi:DNA (cytosine-5)-methyltransferase 1